jgi:hypothetical protein
METPRRMFSAKDAVVGTILILFGSVLLLNQLDIFYLDELGIHSVWQLWPFILVVIGIGKLVDAPTFYHVGNGIWWIFMGLFLYVTINHVYGLYFSDTWPALLVAWGISMMWESLTKHSRVYKEDYYGKQ